MEEVKPKTEKGLILAAYFLAGIIYYECQKFSSNAIYELLLAIVSIGAGWLHYKTRFIENSLFRWIVLAMASAFILGFVASIVNRLG